MYGNPSVKIAQMPACVKRKVGAYNQLYEVDNILKILKSLLNWSKGKVLMINGLVKYLDSGGEGF